MVRILSIILLSFLLLTIASCAFLDKLAPSQYDEAGNRIPGTHQATMTTQNVAGAIPYGSIALNVLLLMTNFVEIAKKNKTEKGLMATIRAIEQASKDPLIQDAIAKLKEMLAEGHQQADVQPLINQLLAKIKYSV